MDWDDAPFDDDDSLPVVPARQPELAGLSSVAAAFSSGTSADNKTSLQLLTVFQTGRKPSATSAQRNAADSALHTLVANLFRLVLVIAREQISNRYGVEGISERTPDMVQEATIAITEAAMRFDVSSGGQWSAYAARAIRDKLRSVTVAEEITTTPASWKRVRRIAKTRLPELREELGRSPSIEELREDLLGRCMLWAEGKLSESERLLPAPQRAEVQMARLRKQGTLAALNRLPDVLASGTAPVALEAPSGEDRTVGDTMADTSGNDQMWDSAELSDVRARLHKALSTLDERSRQVIMHRFGFADGTPWTHARLAAELGISSERVRQIEQEALLSIKAVAVQHGLEGLL